MKKLGSFAIITYSDKNIFLAKAIEDYGNGDAYYPFRFKISFYFIRKGKLKYVFKSR